MGAVLALQLASRHPQRVDAALVIAPAVPALTPPPADRPSYSFSDELDTEEGWAKYTRHYWLRDYRGFLEFFFGQIFPEPHTTKQIEDCVAFGLDTTPGTLTATQLASWGVADRAAAEALCRSVQCPVVVMHGSDDRLVPVARAERVAELTHGTLIRLRTRAMQRISGAVAGHGGG
jgi:pimeloyl-ACP methyl ester carboxylesterase